MYETTTEIDKDMDETDIMEAMPIATKQVNPSATW
jgi:hypothetical protein